MKLSAQDKKMRRLFLEEATEHLQIINDQLMSLEQGAEDPKGALSELLRAAHSVKGTAAATGLSGVEQLVHNWESCVEQLSSGKVKLGSEAFDLLYRALDAIEATIHEECTGVAPAKDIAPPSATELKRVFGKSLKVFEAKPAQEMKATSNNEVDFVQTQAPVPARSNEVDDSWIRVDTAKIDRLMTCVEDLVQVKAGGLSRERDLRKLETTVEELGRGLERFRGLLRELSGGGAQFLGSLDELRRQQEEAARLSAGLSLEVRHHGHVLDGLADRLQDDIRSVRMVPVEEAFAVLPRMVRDLSRKLGKDVIFSLEGGTTEIDRDLVEVLKSPVTHLLRNALSHGIESKEARAGVGKTTEGHLTVRAMGRAGGLVLMVEDDGSGVEVEKVRKTALSKKLLTEDEAGSLSEQEVLDLVFTPGFSTASKVDEVSGRGVGLDIVRERVEGCGGSVLLESTPGAGTKFTLRLPLNLTSIRMLLLRVSSELYAVPVGAVARVLRVSARDVKQVDDGLACEVEGRPVAIDRLSRLVGVNAVDERTERSPAIVLRSGASQAAVLVDAIEGEQELIVKSLGGHLLGIPNVSGATVLANGRVVPVLHAPDLVRSLAIGRRSEELFAEVAEDGKVNVRVLIVDDSITTRTLEKSILEAAGYEVEIATDGVDALQKLKQSTFQLVLSDFQMPRMDGLELVARIKADEKYREIPVVLVSSLASDDDRARGLKAGADAYLGKGEFTQSLLLQTLERLL